MGWRDSRINALWFGAAFRFFSLQQVNAAKVLVMRHQRDSPLFASMAALVRFLGGMNLALAILSASLAGLWLTGSDLFNGAGERIVLIAVLGVAHLTQFGFKLPVLRQRAIDDRSLWPVTTGPMGRIFFVDLSLGAVNIVCVGALLAVA